MATERLPMRHIREILRLKWALEAEPPRHGAEPGDQSRRRGVGHEPGHGDRADVGRARGADRRRPGTTALRAEDSGRRRAPAARSGLDPHRTAPRRRHAGAPAPGVSAAASGRLSLFGLLRALPRVARPAAPVHAAGAQGRGEALCRLLRQDGRRSSMRRPGSCARRVVCRRPGRLELHLCRGDGDAAERRFHSEPWPSGGVSGRRPRRDRAGSAARPASATPAATNRSSSARTKNGRRTTRR